MPTAAPHCPPSSCFGSCKSLRKALAPGTELRDLQTFVGDTTGAMPVPTVKECMLMFDVVALGELLIDFACASKDEAGYPTLAANPGGAPGNFLAAALQAYGCTTAMLSKVGTDAFGKLLVGTLENRGIDTRGIIMDADVFTTLAFVTLDDTGNREFSFARKPGADTRLTEAEALSTGLIDDCRVFHFGTLSLTDEPVRSATRAAIARAKALGKLISLDPNLRKPLWKSEDEPPSGGHREDQRRRNRLPLGHFAGGRSAEAAL